MAQRAPAAQCNRKIWSLNTQAARQVLRTEPILFFLRTEMAYSLPQWQRADLAKIQRAIEQSSAHCWADADVE